MQTGTHISPALVLVGAVLVIAFVALVPGAVLALPVVLLALAALVRRRSRRLARRLVVAAAVTGIVLAVLVYGAGGTVDSAGNVATR